MPSRLRQPALIVALVACLLGVYVASSAQSPAAAPAASARAADSGDDSPTVIDTNIHFSWQVVIVLLAVASTFVANRVSGAAQGEKLDKFIGRVDGLLAGPDGLCQQVARLDERVGEHHVNSQLHPTRAEIVTRAECSAMHTALLNDIRTDLRTCGDRRAERDREIERQMQSAIDGMETLRRTFVAAMGHGAAG